MNVDQAAWFISSCFLFTEQSVWVSQRKFSLWFTEECHDLDSLCTLQLKQFSYYISCPLLYEGLSKKAGESETIKDFQLMTLHFLKTDPKLQHYILFSIACYFIDFSWPCKVFFSVPSDLAKYGLVTSVFQNMSCQN